MLTVGSSAPAFKLPAKPGETVDVGALFGQEKVVLLFIPLAFSSVCTAEMCHFRDSWQQWQDIGARVFAISIDSPFVVAKFRELERIPFPVLSDFNKEVAQQYGALHAELMGLKGVTKRAAFVVGRDGKLAYAWVSENPGIQVDFAAVEQAVRNAP
jgi:peroxiredoxin